MPPVSFRRLCDGRNQPNLRSRHGRIFKNVPIRCFGDGFPVASRETLFWLSRGMANKRSNKLLVVRSSRPAVSMANPGWGSPASEKGEFVATYLPCVMNMETPSLVHLLALYILVPMYFAVQRSTTERISRTSFVCAVTT